MYSGDDFYDDDITSGPIDHDAERNSMWCDVCGIHHSGDCDDNDDNYDDLSGEFDDVAQGRYDFD